KNDYHTAYMDLRSYTLFSKRYALALRLVGGGSGGKQPQNFELNGYYGVRGYEGEEVGKNIILASTELRVPFLDYLSLAFPIPLTITSIRGSVFADLGGVWDDTNQFRVIENNRLRDMKLGFGLGPRMNIGFAVLKFDVAWLTDLANSSKPTFYLSLTEDF
ncbi:MAG: BamA/TamA family outer membrane protein, partial [Candidatus Cloacimonadaceae bacterium]